MALSAGQKKMLMYGVPVVAALALFVVLRSKSSTPSTATASGTTSASDTAVGVGQLASFENALQGQIASLAASLPATSGTTAVAPAPNPTPSTPTPSTAPAPTSAGFSTTSIGGMTYDLLGINTQGGGYNGYEVGGGAPVYFLAPGSTTPVQGKSQDVAGAQVLVPSIYSTEVSKNIFSTPPPK